MTADNSQACLTPSRICDTHSAHSHLGMHLLCPHLLFGLVLIDQAHFYTQKTLPM